MKLYSARAIENCSEQESVQHNREIDDVLKKLRSLEDYRCVVLIQPQDEPRQYLGGVEESSLHNLKEILLGADCKNGCDLMTDYEDEYLVFMTYGQGYTYAGKYYQCVNAYEILPIQGDMFLDVVSYLRGGEVKIAENQHDDQLDCARGCYDWKVL